MTIVSRVITASQTRSNGTVRCSAIITDSNGHKIRSRGINATSLVAAQALIDARDYTEVLKRFDLRELLAFTTAGGDPATWDLTDRWITKNEGLDYLVTVFATSKGVEAIAIATWLSGLSNGTLVAIRNRLGLSVAAGNRLKTRSDLMADAAPTFDQVEEVA